MPGAWPGGPGAAGPYPGSRKPAHFSDAALIAASEFSAVDLRPRGSTPSIRSAIRDAALAMSK